MVKGVPYTCLTMLKWYDALYPKSIAKKSRLTGQQLCYILLEKLSSKLIIIKDYTTFLHAQSVACNSLSRKVRMQ